MQDHERCEAPSSVSCSPGNDGYRTRVWRCYHPTRERFVSRFPFSPHAANARSCCAWRGARASKLERGEIGALGPVNECEIGGRRYLFELLIREADDAARGLGVARRTSERAKDHLDVSEAKLGSARQLLLLVDAHPVHVCPIPRCDVGRQSRCPQEATASVKREGALNATSAVKVGASRATSFSLLIDPLSDQTSGSEADVYYVTSAVSRKTHRLRPQ